MKKRVLCLFCALLLAVLPGCSLAKAGPDTPQADRLIGSFVTFEWLDGRYPLREGEMDNSDPYHPKVRFADLEGIPIFYRMVEEPEQSVTHVGTEDPRVFDDHTTIKVGEGVSYEATLNILPNTVLYFNKLYLRPDGSVYLNAETGNSFGNGEGAIFYSETNATPTGSWEDVPQTTEFIFRIKTHESIAQYVLCHMSADNRELKREIFLPGQLPESLTMAGDWLLVEEWQEGTAVERTAWGPDDQVLHTLVLEESGIFSKVESTLSW